MENILLKEWKTDRNIILLVREIVRKLSVNCKCKLGVKSQTFFWFELSVAKQKITECNLNDGCGKMRAGPNIALQKKKKCIWFDCSCSIVSDKLIFF